MTENINNNLRPTTINPPEFRI